MARRGAFTLVELLAILAVLALLVAVRLPALAKATQRTQRVQCASNLRQVSLAVQISAGESNDKLPPVPDSSWAWDLPVSVADVLGAYGATRHFLYCPAYPEHDDEGWSYSPTFHVIGYATTFPGSTMVRSTNQNATLAPQSIRFVIITFPPPLASQRPLLADATISYYNNEKDRVGNNYAGIRGGWSGSQRSPHLNKGEPHLPTGGNVAMLDGHVEWRDFAAMHVRTTSGPYFWW